MAEARIGKESFRGFTLLELLVVLAIIGIIMTITITSQSSFNQSLVLANTSIDVALTLRNAQTYGIGTRVAGSAVNAGYGLDFSSASPGTFTLFTDTYPLAGASGTCHPLPPNGASAPDAYPGNCSYDSAQGEKVQTYTLNNGMKITNFCAYLLGPTFYCVSGGTNTISRMDIVFDRPNPNQYLTIFDTNGNQISDNTINRACIQIASPQGTTRKFALTPAGQILGPFIGTCP